MEKRYQLSKKHLAFIQEFLNCGDIDTAAAAVGLLPDNVVKSLTNNTMGFSDKLRQAIHRKKVSASYHDPDAILNSLFKMATDVEAKADARVRASHIWLQHRDGAGEDTGSNEDKFKEILQIVGKKDE